MTEEKTGRARSLANLKRYPKGTSPFPGGRPRIPDEFKDFGTLSIDAVRRIIGKYTRMPVEDLIVAKEDPKLPALEAAIASVLLMSIKHGDMARLDMMLSRIHAKPKETIEVVNQYQSMTTVELVEVGEQAIKTLKETT